MNLQSILRLFLALGFALLCSARAAEYQVRTADGQTLQGEYLGLEDGIIKLRTKYGEVKIASKDVLTMTAVAAAPKPAPADQPAEEPAAEKGIPAPPPPPPAPPPKAPRPAPKESAKPEPPPEPEAPPQAFPEPRMPDPVALANARAAQDAPPEPSKAESQEIFRALRNFADTNQVNRGKIIRLLQSYGRMADPYIASAYTNPEEIGVRVDFLQALAVPGRALTTPVFADAHRTALAAMEQADAGQAPPPPEYLSKQDRGEPQTRSELLRSAASNVVDLEGYMSTAGGPFNTLFLLDVYRRRYTSDKTPQQLLGVPRDRTRLAAAAADAGRAKSAWTRDDRVGVIELALPMLFRDNDALRALAQELLKKLLPASHPKWTASEDDWVTWWEKAREKIK